MVPWDLTDTRTENVSNYNLTKICVLNMVTWDLTGRWTENVSKYKIEQKSVYITWKTWDLTEDGMKMNPNVRLN